LAIFLERLLERLVVGPGERLDEVRVRLRHLLVLAVEHVRDEQPGLLDEPTGAGDVVVVEPKVGDVLHLEQLGAEVGARPLARPPGVAVLGHVDVLKKRTAYAAAP
jgi:hypothetical protein